MFCLLPRIYNITLAKFGQNLQNPHISEFKLLQALASLGPRGNISLAKHQESNKLFVIKTLNKAHLSYDTPVLEQVMTEQMILRLLTQMDLPFVIKLRWSFQDKEALYLAMVGLSEYDSLYCLVA